MFELSAVISPNVIMADYTPNSMLDINASTLPQPHKEPKTSVDCGPHQAGRKCSAIVTAMPKDKQLLEVPLLTSKSLENIKNNRSKQKLPPTAPEMYRPKHLPMAC